METPEGRELRRQWSNKPRKNGGRPIGVSDGYTKESIAPIQAQAKIDAKRITQIMSDKYNIEVGETRERLAAARLVLDFTKSKPAAKSDVSIHKAEDFLASLLIEDGDTDESEQAIESSTETTSDWI